MKHLYKFIFLFTLLFPIFSNAQNINLCGIWYSYEYGCYNQYKQFVPVFEVFVIAPDGNQVIATKIIGDDCVTSGNITWQGRDSSYVIYNSPTDSFKVFNVTCLVGSPSSPNCCEVNAWVKVVDSTHIQLGPAANGGLTNIYKYTCAQLDSLGIKPETYGINCICNKLPQPYPIVDSILPCSMVLPNAFSPNNDGNNDKFGPLTPCAPDEYSFKVFNRWGENIFTTSNVKTKWDGNYNGKQCPIETYAWVVTYKANNKNFLKKGTVTLIR